MDAKWFGARLRELRSAAGMTQEQLAGGAGMTANAVARLERGERSPIWETVVALSRALGVSCDAFMQQPGEQPEAKRGRPKKASQGDVQAFAPTPAAKPKRKRKEK